MKPEHLPILQHSLGVDKYGRGSQYRNYYVIGPECDGFADCRELVAAGLMSDSGPCSSMSGMHVFRVTDEGRSAMRSASPLPPKLTKSQQRYRDFLNADSGLSFIEWLKFKQA